MVIWVPSGLVMVRLRAGVEAELPAAFVGEVVVFGAQRQQVGDVGRPAVAVPVEVVDDDVVPRDTAAGYGAASVHRPQRSALGAVGQVVWCGRG